MNPTNTTPPKILYVDDDQDDCVLLKESFSDTGNTNMVLAFNGDEAIEYLDSNESLPSLIIMDLNMPPPRWQANLAIHQITTASFRNTGSYTLHFQKPG